MTIRERERKTTLTSEQDKNIEALRQCHKEAVIKEAREWVRDRSRDCLLRQAVEELEELEESR